MRLLQALSGPCLEALLFWAADRDVSRGSNSHGNGEVPSGRARPQALQSFRETHGQPGARACVQMSFGSPRAVTLWPDYDALGQASFVGPGAAATVSPTSFHDGTQNEALTGSRQWPSNQSIAGHATHRAQ